VFFIAGYSAAYNTNTIHTDNSSSTNPISENTFYQGWIPACAGMTDCCFTVHAGMTDCCFTVHAGMTDFKTLVTTFKANLTTDTIRSLIYIHLSNIQHGILLGLPQEDPKRMPGCKHGIPMSREWQIKRKN